MFALVTALHLLAGGLVATAILSITLVLAAAVAGLMAYHFAQAKLRERRGFTIDPASGSLVDEPEAAADVRAKSAEEISQIRSRIEVLMEEQNMRSETQNQHLAQRLDDIRSHMGNQDRKLDGLKSELRHEIHRRDGELDELRGQLASALDSFWKAMPAVGEGAQQRALPPAAADATEVPASPPAFESAISFAPTEPVAAEPTYIEPVSVEPAPTPAFTPPAFTSMADFTPAPETPRAEAVEAVEIVAEELVAEEIPAETPVAPPAFAPAWSSAALPAPPVAETRAEPAPAPSPSWSDASTWAAVMTPDTPAPTPEPAMATLEFAPAPEAAPAPATPPPAFGSADSFYTPPPAAPAVPAAPPVPDDADTLTVIRGVSEEIQQKLYAAGVYHLDEMARWSRADARRISLLVDVPEETITHEWIFEAQSVLFDSYQQQMMPAGRAVAV